MFTVTVETDATGGTAIGSDIEAIIVFRFQAGESQVSIARALGLGTFIVRRVLKEHRIPPHPKCPVSGPHQQAILSLHAEGKTIKEISDGLSLNFATVYRVLLRNGRVKKKERKP
jgi:DNA-binding NarL/FixJ family response regulator